MILSLVAAFDENSGIGFEQKLPWNFPEDLKNFKKLTLNKPIVMGRKTFDSLPGILPNRKHIILSQDDKYKEKILKKYPDIIVVSSIEDFFKYKDNHQEEEYCIIGGGLIWKLFLPYIDIMHITHIKGVYNADAFFPYIDCNNWNILKKEDFDNFSFVTYTKK